MSASSISFKSFALPTHPSLYDTAVYYGCMKMEHVQACAAEFSMQAWTEYVTGLIWIQSVETFIWCHPS